MNYETKVFLIGNNAGITVPEDIIEKLGGGKRPAVEVTINGYTYRTTVAPMSGEYRIPINAARRADIGVAGGDPVTVTISLDNTPREVTVPTGLAAALTNNPQASHFFNTLTYSQKRNFTDWIDDAKKDETQRDRISKAIQMLESNTKR